MNNLGKNKWTFFLIILAITIAVSGCNGGAEEEALPTLDPNLVYTEAAQTVAAQLTLAATEAPPATATVPPEPTVAPQMEFPTPTLPPLPDAGDAALPQTANTPLAPAQPTVAATKADKVEDIARLIGQAPLDGQQYPAGAKFDLTLAYVNDADTTWNDLYTVRPVSWYGDTFGAKSKYTFGVYADNKTVNKGEAVTLFIPGLQAPSAAGIYTSLWCICNNREDEGKAFQCFRCDEIRIKVE